MSRDPAKAVATPRPKPEEPVRPRLGRGLAALLGDTGAEAEAVVRARGQKRVPIEFLHRSPLNPRVKFETEDLAELTESIREKGVIQPLLVRTKPGVADAYEIVAGERRWRAATAAGLHEVPVVLIEADDKQALEIAIIENVQRTNLNILEEAQGYERLMREFGYSQTDVAKVIGKSRPHVANTMRLLKLPDQTRSLITADAITAGHARALLGSANPDALGERIVAKGLSVRAVEDMIRREQQAREAAGSGASKARTKDPDTRALERRISDRIGLTVDIKHSGEGGEVRLKYASLEQLDKLVALLES